MSDRAWWAIVSIVAVVICVAPLFIAGCQDPKLLTRNFEKPPKPEPVKPKVAEVAKPLEEADKLAVKLALDAPAEMRPAVNALLEKIVEARVKLAEASAAAGVADANADKLHALVCKLLKQVDALQARIEDIEDDNSMGTAGWFMVVGGITLAAGVGVAIWLALGPGLIAATVGLVMFALGLVLRFILANMWIVWTGGLIVAGLIAYAIYKTGSLTKLAARLKDYIAKMGRTIGGADNAVELAKATAQQGTEGLGAILEEQGVTKVDITPKPSSSGGNP